MDDYVLTEHVSVLVCISIGYVNVTVIRVHVCVTILTVCSGKPLFIMITDLKNNLAMYMY